VEGKDIQTSNFSVWSYQKTDPQTGGVALGGIQNITYTDVPTPYYSYGYGMGGGGGGAESAVASINPGQLQVTATVNVTYGIK
jgi:uncharacterized protein YggE